MLTLDFLPLMFVNNLSFVSQYLVTDYIDHSAHLETSLLFTHASTSLVKGLHASYMLDLNRGALVDCLPVASLFLSSFYGIYRASVLLTPELALVLTDYLVICERSQSFNARPSVCFDSGVNALNCLAGEGSLPLVMLLLLAWFVIYMVLTNTFLPWSSYSHSQFARSYVYVFSFSKETRVQLEVVLQTTVLFLFY